MAMAQSYRLGHRSLLGSLMGLLALFGGLGACSRGLGLCLLLGGIPLGVGLVLLGLTLTDQVFASGYRTDGFLCLALGVFDDTLDCFLRT